MSIKLPRLMTLLKYQHAHVIKRYMKDYAKTKPYAERTFQELLKLFWLMQKSRVSKSGVDIIVYHEMLEIDNMWHTFLLFTKDYMSFCDKYFGIYIHHQPNIEKFRKLSKQELAERNEKFEKFLFYIYDNLGEKTVKSWFKSSLYPAKLA